MADLSAKIDKVLLNDGIGPDTRARVLKVVADAEVEEPARPSILDQHWKYDMRHIDIDSTGKGVWDITKRDYVNINEWKKEIAALPDMARALKAITGTCRTEPGARQSVNEVTISNVKQTLLKAGIE